MAFIPFLERWGELDISEGSGKDDLGDGACKQRLATGAWRERVWYDARLLLFHAFWNFQGVSFQKL